MGLFTPSFDKPGKGIDPDAPQKRSFFRFFDIFFRKFWKFIKLNLLYLLTGIPTFIIIFIISGFVSNAVFSIGGVSDVIQNIVSQMPESAGDIENQYSIMIVSVDILIRFIVSVLFMVLWGMGPVTAGITYVMRNYAREEHAWIWSDFKDTVKSNFKQSAVVFVVDIVVFTLLCFAYIVYAQMPNMLANLRFLIVLIGMIFTLMHFYIYPMMVTFDLKLKDLYKNSIIFAIGKLPSNLLVFVIILLIHVGGIYSAIMFSGKYIYIVLLIVALLELLILPAVSVFLINFNSYPKLKKYMMENGE